MMRRNKDLERWESMDKERMILELRNKELERKPNIETKKERALRRKGYWKNLRNPSDQEGEKDQDDQGQEEKRKEQGGKLAELVEKTKEMRKRHEDWKRDKTATEEIPGMEEVPEEIAGMEEAGEFCLECVYSPCICILVTLDLRMQEYRKRDDEDEGLPGEKEQEVVVPVVPQGQQEDDHDQDVCQGVEDQVREEGSPVGDGREASSTIATLLKLRDDQEENFPPRTGQAVEHGRREGSPAGEDQEVPPTPASLS